MKNVRPIDISILCIVAAIWFLQNGLTMWAHIIALAGAFALIKTLTEKER